METNGNIATFSWYHERRIESLQGQGLAPEAVQGLRARGDQVSALLATYHARRKTAGDSGKFSASGLAEVERALAAETAGALRRAVDDSDLRANIEARRAKLAQRTAPDPQVELVNFWRRMEVRSQLDRLAITILDPATGSLSFDQVVGDMLYRQALQAGNELVCLALEEWPSVDGHGPVSPELIAEGQRRRQNAVDPVAAKELSGLEALAEAMTNMLRDALDELPAPPQDDPIARMAGAPVVPTEAA